MRSVAKHIQYSLSYIHTYIHTYIHCFSYHMLCDCQINWHPRKRDQKRRKRTRTQTQAALIISLHRRERVKREIIIMSQCIVPNWNLKHQRQEQVEEEEKEEEQGNRSSHVLNPRNTHLVPMYVWTYQIQPSYSLLHALSSLLLSMFIWYHFSF